MGEPSWRSPSAPDLLHLRSPVPELYMLPHPHLLPDTWFGKASPQAGKEAQGDAWVAALGMQ